MPIRHLNIETGLEGRMEFPVLCGLFKLIGPVLITEPKQPLSIFWDIYRAAQTFGKTRPKTSMMIWIMELERSGDSAIASEAAATTIAMIAAVVGSIRIPL